jgi:hypothetical protein
MYSDPILIFQVRRTCEHLMKQIRLNLQQNSKGDLLRRVMSYRAGYTPQDRRRIEKQMFSGDLLAVIATNALELGVDIGSLGTDSWYDQFSVSLPNVPHNRCRCDAWYSLVNICNGKLVQYKSVLFMI